MLLFCLTLLHVSKMNEYISSSFSFYWLSWTIQLNYMSDLMSILYHINNPGRKSRHQIVQNLIRSYSCKIFYMIISIRSNNIVCVYFFKDFIRFRLKDISRNLAKFLRWETYNNWLNDSCQIGKRNFQHGKFQHGSLSTEISAQEN
jgi:hypothetical protein